MVHRFNRRIVRLSLAGLALLTALLSTSCPKGGAREPATEAVKLPVYSKPVADSATGELIPAAEEIAAADGVTVGEGAPVEDTAVPAGIDPAELYANSYCAFCHEPEKGGQVMGPKLEKLRENWTAEELAKFLRNPGDYSRDNPRLIEIGRSYKRLMPSSHLSDEELAALSVWVLEKFE